MNQASELDQMGDIAYSMMNKLRRQSCGVI